MENVNNRIKCFVTGDKIKNIDEITEDDKTEFIPLSDEMVRNLFTNLIDDDAVDELQSGLDYELHSIEWYMDRFPGFDYETYVIMKEEGDKLNK
jgi:hypothetical protein